MNFLVYFDGYNSFKCNTNYNGSDKLSQALIMI
jgi:hypothetical protein